MKIGKYPTLVCTVHSFFGIFNKSPQAPVKSVPTEQAPDPVALSRLQTHLRTPGVAPQPRTGPHRGCLWCQGHPPHLYQLPEQMKVPNLSSPSLVPVTFPVSGGAEGAQDPTSPSPRGSPSCQPWATAVSAAPRERDRDQGMGDLPEMTQLWASLQQARPGPHCAAV